MYWELIIVTKVIRFSNASDIKNNLQVLDAVGIIRL